MQSVKSRIGAELIILEGVKEDIEPYTNGPQDSVQEPLRGKVIELANKSKKFSEALLAMSGRFHRAGSSTYHDTNKLYQIDLVVQYTAGRWFKDYVTTFPGYEQHDFARKTWIKAMNVSQRLCNLNGEAIVASKQVDQVVLFMPLLASVLLTLIFALFVSFISGVVYSDGSQGTLLPITKLTMSIGLVILLPIQLIGIIKHLWSLFLSKYVGDETTRLHDEHISQKIESKYSLDYKEALKSQVDILLKSNHTDS